MCTVQKGEVWREAGNEKEKREGRERRKREGREMKEEIRENRERVVIVRQLLRVPADMA